MEAARRRAAAVFRDGGSESADLDARILICAACDIQHAALVRDPGLPLGSAFSRFSAFVARRLAGEPVARILGRREFWGLSFAVDPAVLDPRPETESLVGSVLDALGDRRSDGLNILDLGTGSAAILCALLSELPMSRGIGVDSSPSACRTAAANVAALGFADRAHIVCCCWTESLRGQFDVVVSNPPYIRRAELSDLAAEVRNHDPLDALDGGSDGLTAFRAIMPNLRVMLVRGAVAAFECGFDQGDAVAQLMQAAGLDDAKTYKDLAGHDRVVIGHLT